MKTALTQLIDYIESSCTKGGYIMVEPNEILDKAIRFVSKIRESNHRTI